MGRKKFHHFKSIVHLGYINNQNVGLFRPVSLYLTKNNKFINADKTDIRQIPFEENI